MSVIDLLVLESFSEIQNSEVYSGWIDTAKTNLIERNNTVRTKIDGVADSDDFDEDEYLLAAIMALAFSQKGESLKEDLLALYSSPESFTTARMDQILESARREMSEVVLQDTTISINVKEFTTLATEAGVDRDAIDTIVRAGKINPRDTYERIVERSIDKGADITNSSQRIKNVILRDTLVDRLKNSISDFNNEYYERFLEQEIRTLTEQAISGVSVTDPDFTADFTRVRNHITNKFGNNPYWRIVANQNVSRSYHYGVLKGGQANGFTKYQYKAIIDDRTSDICTNLHNKTFVVSEGLDILEKAMRAQGTEVKDTNPWPRNGEEINSLAERELAEKGYTVPPQHANCRSSIRLLTDSLR
jgi:hypothetical protein